MTAPNNDVIELISVFNKMKNQWIEFSNRDERKAPYWVMKHQIISLCNQDQQQAQKDLDMLVSEGLLFQFQLPLSHREALIMRGEDFEAIVRQALTSSVPIAWRDPIIAWLSNRSRNYFSTNFPWPSDNIISQDLLFRSLDTLIEDVEQRNVCIDNHDHETRQPPAKRRRTTRQAMSPADDDERSHGSSGGSGERSNSLVEHPSKDDILKFLIHKGFLRRLQGQRFTVAMPGCGTFITNLTRGRKAILSLLRKRKNQIIRAEMFSRYRSIVSSTFLSMEYLLCDMEGLGLLTSIEGPSGPILLPARD